jgi:hypothetical protein
MNDLSCIYIVDMTFNNCNFKIAGENNCLLGKCVWIEHFVDHKHYNMPMRRQKRWPIESHRFSAKWSFPTTIYCRSLALAIQYSEVSGQLTNWLSVRRRQRSIRNTTTRHITLLAKRNWALCAITLNKDVDFYTEC